MNSGDRFYVDKLIAPHVLRHDTIRLVLALVSDFKSIGFAFKIVIVIIEMFEYRDVNELNFKPR